MEDVSVSRSRAKPIYPVRPEAEKIERIRRFETVDIVRRLGVLTPNHVYLRKFPVKTPLAIFNASATVSGETLEIYARIVVGYYMYVSAIVKIEVPLEDVLTGAVTNNPYTADIVLRPDVKQDIWGCEDPRAVRIGEDKYIVYTGRTIWYFNPVVRKERTLPVLAKCEGNSLWRKICTFVQPEEVRKYIISDKDAFIAKVDGRLFLFHRPHLKHPENGEGHYCVVSEISAEEEAIKECKLGDPEPRALPEVMVRNTKILVKEAPFEKKIGWSTPLVEVGRNRYVTLVHGVGKIIEAYRVFALMLEYRRDEGFVPVAVTPTYILEPKEPHEVYGDRPHVVFPCGLEKISGDELLVTYGAADYSVSFGIIDLNELLSHLEEGTIE